MLQNDVSHQPQEKSKASEPNGSAFNREIYPWELSLVLALISQKADKEHWVFLFSVSGSCHTASAETAVQAGYEMCFSSLVRNFNFCACSEILVGISMTSCIKWTQNNCGSEAPITPVQQGSDLSFYMDLLLNNFFFCWRAAWAAALLSTYTLKKLHACVGRSRGQGSRTAEAQGSRSHF